VQPRVLERDPGRGADRVEQRGLLAQRRVVHQRGHARTVPIDERRCSPDLVPGAAAPRGHRRPPSCRTPAASRRAGATGRAARAPAHRANRRARARRASRAAVGERQPGEPRAQQPDEEGGGRQPDDEEGGAPDRLEVGPLERAGQEERGDHHQAERERVDEERHRAAQRSPGHLAPRGEHPDADQAERADGDELDVEQRAGGARLGDDLEARKT
jgi:hypothetical protein